MTDAISVPETDEFSGDYLRDREAETSPAARVAAFEARRDRQRRTIEAAREQAEILRENRRNVAADTALGAARGPVSAINELFIATKDFSRWLLPLDQIVGGVSSTFRGEGFAAGVAATNAANAEFNADLRRSADELLPDTETTAGGVAEGISQFLTGFVPAFRVANVGQAATRLGQFTRATAAGAVVDATVFDPHEARLSDLVQQYPVLANPVSEYLASDPSDSAAEGRFKNAIEGAVVGSAIDGLLRGLRVIRAARRLRVEAEVEAKVSAEDIEIPEVRPAEAPVDDTAASLADDIAEQVDNVRSTAGEPPVPREVPSIRVRPEDVAEFQRRVAEGDLSEAQKLIDFNADTIAFDSIEDGADLRRIINTTSETFESLIDEVKGGVQTIEETKRLAREVGAKPSEVDSLFADVRGDKGITARVLAAEQTMLASAQRLKQLARAVVENGDNVSRMAMAQHIELHAAIQAQVKGAKAEIARSLHAMRVMKQASEINFDEFSDIARQLGNDPASTALAKQLADATGLNEINKLVRKTRWQRFRDVSLEVWINGLLSSPKTHAVNTLSNTVKAIEAGVERFVAAGVGSVRRTVFRQSNAEVIRFREATAVAYGTLKGLSDVAKIPAKLRRGEDALPFLDTKSKLEVDTNKAIQFSVDNAEGLRRVTAQAGNLMGSAVRIPGAALQAGDNVFKTIAYRQQIHALSYRRAAQLADEAGLSGAQRGDFITNKMAELADELPEDIHLAAVDFSRYQTFTNELGEVGRAFQGFLGRVPVLRFIFPFVRTPVNIIKQVAERSPLPLFRTLQREYREMLLRGGPEADLVIARIGLGTGLMYSAWEMADAGLVTGGGAPGRNTEDLKGVKPYSIKIGDKWYVYNRLEPLGMLMGTMADFKEIVDRNFDPDGDNTELEDAARLILFGAMSNITSKTYLRGASELFQVLSDPERHGDRYLKNFASSLIPFSGALRAVRQREDKFARETFTYLESLKSGLPGLSDDLPLRRDILGRPIVPGTQWLSPIQVSQESTDPLNLELSRLAFGFSMPSKQIDGVPLNAEQYSELLRIRGQEKLSNGNSLEDTLRDFIGTADYQALLEDRDATVIGTKQDAIKRIISKFQRAAKERLLEKYPELRQRVEVERERRRPGVDQNGIVTDPVAFLEGAR